MEYQQSPEGKLKNQKRAVAHRYLNLVLAVFVVSQIGFIYYLNSQEKLEKVIAIDEPKTEGVKDVPEFEEEEVEPSPSKPVAQPSGVKTSESAVSESAEKPVEVAADPWSTAELETKVENDQPVKKSKVSKEEQLLVSTFESDIEDFESGVQAPSLIEELRLSDKQASILAMKHQRLMGELQKADEKGAEGLRRILINDHLAWAKEFLGREKYERYVRASSGLLAAVH